MEMTITPPTHETALLRLSGTFTIDPPASGEPTGQDHVWRGTLQLPAVRIVAKSS